MPSRLIRSEMLESERLQTLPVEARWMFVCIALSADDLGLFEASPYIIGRRAGIDPKQVPALLQLCADADLIRLYEVAEKRYLFIPRFRQRLQIKRSRFPRPPDALMVDDEDASSKFNNLGSNPRLDNGEHRKKTVIQPPEPEPEPEPEEERDKETLEPSVLVGTAYRPAPSPNAEILDSYHKHRPILPRVEVLNVGRKRHIAARWKEVCVDGKLDRAQGLEWFDWYFSHAAKSQFLTGKLPGKSGRMWQADFDFLMTPSKFARVVEGSYHKDTV